MIYFDHNASMPLLPEARQTWLETCELCPGNPSSPHRAGRRAEAALQQARERLAALLGCDAPDLVWTSGATESNNLVLYHAARSSPPEAEIWVSSLEHPSVLAAATCYFPNQRCLIPALRSGVIDLDWLQTRLQSKRPALVAVMAANNETGVLQPWAEILTLCREREVPFFCDAAQWLGKLSPQGLGECDFLSGCAHKFGGPKGAGFLKCPAQGAWHGLLHGGSQEGGRRAGTENVPGVVSMVAALEVCQRLRQTNSTRLAWRNGFADALRQSFPDTQIVGANQERLWNTLSALMTQAGPPRRWVIKLDKLGFAVSSGSACASGREKPSRVLEAMGYSPPDTSRMLRFSAGWETTGADWLKLLEGIRLAHRQIREEGAEE